MVTNWDKIITRIEGQPAAHPHEGDDVLLNVKLEDGRIMQLQIENWNGNHKGTYCVQGQTVSYTVIDVQFDVWTWGKKATPIW